MQDDVLRLAELMCSRLCHDLAGPVGAVSNGAELLEEEDPELAREAAGLMAGAAQQIAKRLRFFRAAFGWEGGAAKDLAEAGNILKDFLAPLPGQPPRFEIEGPAGEVGSAESIRMLLLLAFLGSEVLPRGGRLLIGCTDSLLSVNALGSGAGLGELAGVLPGGGQAATSPTPRQAPALLTLGLANRSGWQISVESHQDRVQFQLRR